MAGVRQREPRLNHEPLRLLCRRAAGCYLRLDNCTGAPTAAAHSNLLRHGRGHGYKTHDIYTVPACMSCGRELDHGGHYSREEKQSIFVNAWERWMLDIWRNGWVEVL